MGSRGSRRTARPRIPDDPSPSGSEWHPMAGRRRSSWAWTSSGLGLAKGPIFCLKKAAYGLSAPQTQALQTAAITGILNIWRPKMAPRWEPIDVAGAGFCWQRPAEPLPYRGFLPPLTLELQGRSVSDWTILCDF